MKYIAKVTKKISLNPVSAQDAQNKDFYYQPHGWINGEGVRREFTVRDGELKEEVGDWEFIKVMDDFYEKFLKDFFTISGEKIFTVHAGYTAFVENGILIAESYVSCAGNAVFVIHYGNDEHTIYLNSRRHGLPELAHQYSDADVQEVIMYDSRRTDASPFEYGLKDFSEIDDRKGRQEQKILERLLTKQQVRKLAI